MLIFAAIMGACGVDKIDKAGFIVKNGKANAVIVLPEAPGSVLEYAARELQSHIQKISDAELKIITEKESAAGWENIIYLGFGKATAEAGISFEDAPPNTFHIKKTANILYLAGKDFEGRLSEPATMGKIYEGVLPINDRASMGSLFAVYHWLGEQLGVRWLWPGETGTVIPEAKDIHIGSAGEIIQQPALLHGRLRIGGGKRAMEETSVWLRRQQIAAGISMDYGHGFGKYWERFGEQHPEWFALQTDGKRGPVDTRTNLVQLCVSNPELWKQVIEDWKLQRTREPRKQWINGIENDRRAIDPFCACESCQAWDSRLGQEAEKDPWIVGAELGNEDAKPIVSMSDRYAKFWLALQNEGKKHDPNAKVIGYAYSTYVKPPVETQLNENIIVGMVPSYAFPVAKETAENFRDIWAGWKAKGARLYLRPNYFLLGYCMPYIFAKQFGEEFQFAHKNGMIATDFDSLTGMWGTQGPNIYVLGRLHAYPEMNVSDILDEYYSGFGDAKDEIKSYFEYWENITSGLDENLRKEIGGGWAVVSKGGDQIFTPETFDEAGKFLEKAKKKTQGDFAAQEKVEYLRVWMEHARLSMQTLSAFHRKQEKPSNSTLKQAFLDAWKRLDEYRAEHYEKYFSSANMEALEKVEKWSGWRK